MRHNADFSGLGDDAMLKFRQKLHYITIYVGVMLEWEFHLTKSVTTKIKSIFFLNSQLI